MPSGRVILVGGSEEKQLGGRCAVLREIARQALASGGRLLVLTTATGEPAAVGAMYTSIFRALGLRDVAALDVRDRVAAHAPGLPARIADASLLFLTGGDQRRLTELSDTPFGEAVRAHHRAGLTVAGTSAGAMALAETALTGGPGADHQEPNPLTLTSGLSLLQDAVVDTHFSQRGRLPRLLAAVGRNPHALGLGVDEDTAAVLEDGVLRVIGTGLVYAVDGLAISHASQSGRRPLGVESVHGAVVHVLGQADRFDLATRRPYHPDWIAAPAS